MSRSMGHTHKKHRVVSGGGRARIEQSRAIPTSAEPDATRRRKNRPLHGNSNDGGSALLDGTSDGDDIDGIPRMFSREKFDQDIKLATDNKINITNSWDSHLIDYFTDMNILKNPDGMSINFQMASTTLEGCIKVISKRVDSIGTDADALIQILSLNDDRKGKTGRRRRNSAGELEDDDEDEEEEDPDYNDAKKTKKKARDRIDFITTMEKIRVTDRQLEYDTIDPAFRKMLAEFDEGGAKSLLLNTLRVNDEGRVMLDDAVTSTATIKLLDDVDENDEESEDDGIAHGDESRVKSELDEYEKSIMDVDDDEKVKEERNAVVDPLLAMLKSTVRSDTLAELDICRDIKDIRSSIDDLEYGKSFLSRMSEKITNESKQEEEDLEGDVLPKFNVEYDYDIDNFELDMNHDVYSGQDISENTQLESTRHTLNGDIPDYNEYDGNENENDVDMLSETEANARQEQLMAELDRIAMRKRPHWKIRAMRERTKALSTNNIDLFENEPETNTETTSASSGRPKSKIKSDIARNKTGATRSQYHIDFMHDSPDTDTSSLFQKPKRALPQISADEIRVEDTTMPDLKAWNAERLVTSLLKPKRRFRNMFTKRAKSSRAELIVDREFWASKYNDKSELVQDEDIDEDVADFLNDVMDRKEDGAGDDVHGNGTDSGTAEDDYAMDNEPGGYDFDAPVGGFDPITQTQESQSLQTQSEEIPAGRRNAWYKNTIHFERRSKKINVRLLKQNLWDATRQHVIEEKAVKQENGEESGVDLKLSDIVKDAYVKYEGREKSDLSTSFFFICMLHIANEEGLTIEKTDNLQDVIIHST